MSARRKRGFDADLEVAVDLMPEKPAFTIRPA
jgi:hypothetical protein